MFTVPKTIEILAIERMERNMVESFVRSSGHAYPESLVFWGINGKNKGL